MKEKNFTHLINHVYRAMFNLEVTYKTNSVGIISLFTFLYLFSISQQKKSNGGARHFLDCKRKKKKFAL